MIVERLTAPFERAFAHGRTGHVCHRLFAGSVIAHALSGASRGLIEMRRRLGIGFADPRSTPARALAAEQMSILFDRSAIVRGLEWLAGAIVRAGQESVAARVFVDPLRQLEPAAAVRTAGAVLLSAVVAHTVTFGLLGVTVTTRAWVSRLALVTLGGLLIAMSRLFARAWANSSARRTMARATGADTTAAVGGIQA